VDIDGGVSAPSSKVDEPERRRAPAGQALQLPPGRRNATGQLWFVALTMSVFVVVTPFMVADWFTTPEGPQLAPALFFTGIGLVCCAGCCFAWLELSARHRSVFRARLDTLKPTEEPALLIPGARSAHGAMILIVWGIALAGGGALWIALDFPAPDAFPQGVNPLPWKFHPLLLGPLGAVMVGSALLLGACRIRHRRRGGGSGYLMLTPSGVVYSSWVHGGATGWDAVHAIGVSMRKGSLLQVNLHFRDHWLPYTGLPAALRADRLKMEILPMSLRCDARVLYHALRFYWRNAEARHELGSQVALDRIAQRDLLERVRR
jgi:hypothetical protein